MRGKRGRGKGGKGNWGESEAKKSRRRGQAEMKGEAEFGERGRRREDR